MKHTPTVKPHRGLVTLWGYFATSNPGRGGQEDRFYHYQSRSMGVSKQLSNDLKTKIVHRHGLGEGYRKLSQRFQLSVSTVRNIVRKWKTTGTVQGKARSGRRKEKSRINREAKDVENKNRVNPQTSTKDLQHDLAADGVTVHRSTIRRTLHKEMLYGRVMQRKPFLRPHHKQSRLR
ncbi:hypothetical protein NFI96_014296 [Prochilodus magdalenae]|nr:hypothetical protein NFI96_014296 [Prochilodus magdalenae]